MQRRGLRAGGRGGGDRGRRRAARRRLHHDVSLLAGRVRRRGRDHRDRARRQPARARRALHRRRVGSTSSARSSRRSAWAESCSGSSSGRRAAGRSACSSPSASSRLGSLAWWLRKRKREGKPALIDVGSLQVEVLPPRDLLADDAADRPRRADDRAADLPADGARVQRDGGGPVARAALAEHVRRRAGRRQEGREAQPEQDHPGRVLAARRRRRGADPDRAARALGLGDGRAADGRGRRARAAGLAAEQLHAVADRGGARQRGRGRQLGRRLVRAVVRARLRRRDHARVALAHLHQHGQLERRALAAPGRRRSRRRSRRTPR